MKHKLVVPFCVLNNNYFILQLEMEPECNTDL